MAGEEDDTIRKNTMLFFKIANISQLRYVHCTVQGVPIKCDFQNFKVLFLTRMVCPKTNGSCSRGNLFTFLDTCFCQ